jgi:hypothetical protein
MSQTPAPDSSDFEISQADAKLIKQLNDNPIFGAQIRRLSKLLEEEIASGMDAHEAEEMAIGALNELGQAILKQWADSTHGKTLAETQSSHPELIKSGKKNSGGIRPSAPSE